MKTIKISLAIVVIGLITFFVINSLTILVAPPELPPVENRFTKIITEETIALQNPTVTGFDKLKALYEDVKYDIDDYYTYSRMGKNQLENDQSKERLSKNLYTIYADRFIKQAYSVFNQSEWSSADLKFIRSECITLKKSKFLDNGGAVYNSYSKIQLILSKYDEINSFIASCKGFSYSGNSINSLFPIAIVNQKITRATSYKRNNLENSFVNNCARLHTQLNETTKFLFNAHIRYLDKKINTYSGTYSAYNSHGEYAREFYFKMKSEINGLDSDIYPVSNFDKEYDKLMDKLNQDNSNAKTFFVNSNKI